MFEPLYSLSLFQMISALLYCMLVGGGLGVLIGRAVQQRQDEQILHSSTGYFLRKSRRSRIETT